MDFKGLFDLSADAQAKVFKMQGDLIDKFFDLYNEDKNENKEADNGNRNNAE